MIWYDITMMEPKDSELVMVANQEIPFCFALAVYARGIFVPFQNPLRFPLKITHWSRFNAPEDMDQPIGDAS